MMVGYKLLRKDGFSSPLENDYLVGASIGYKLPKGKIAGPWMTVTYDGCHVAISYEGLRPDRETPLLVKVECERLLKAGYPVCVQGQRSFMRVRILAIVDYAVFPDCKVWFKGGVLHRDGDLPAYVSKRTGDKYWFKNGELHRDGHLPAVKRGDGIQEWWVRGRQV